MPEQGFDMYDLLKGVHYLGYHSLETMTYDYDEARPFTLVTSNEKEVRECVDEYKGRTFIWVIAADVDGRGGTDYLLREVFKPLKYEAAQPEHYSGAKKKFNFSIEGKGYELGDGVSLAKFSWFNKFFEDNGRFGFGLRLLRNQDVKSEFIRLSLPFIRPA